MPPCTTPMRFAWRASATKPKRRRPCDRSCHSGPTSPMNPASGSKLQPWAAGSKGGVSGFAGAGLVFDMPAI